MKKNGLLLMTILFAATAVTNSYAFRLSLTPEEVAEMTKKAHRPFYGHNTIKERVSIDLARSSLIRDMIIQKIKSLDPIATIKNSASAIVEIACDATLSFIEFPLDIIYECATSSSSGNLPFLCNQYPGTSLTYLVLGGVALTISEIALLNAFDKYVFRII